MNRGASDSTSDDFGLRVWVAIVVGFAIMGFGVRELFRFTPQVDRRWDIAKWVIGLDLVHDLVIAPVVCLTGLALARVARGRARAPVQFGVFASATVAAVAFPLVRRYGTTPSNPSIQPLNYATATWTVLGIVWATVLVWTLVSIGATRRPVKSRATPAESDPRSSPRRR